MKIRPLDKVIVAAPKEREIFLKLEGDHYGKYVNVLLTDEKGNMLSHPYVISFQVDPTTQKITFSKAGGVNSDLVATGGTIATIREVQ